MNSNYRTPGSNKRTNNSGGGGGGGKGCFIQLGVVTAVTALLILSFFLS